MECTGMLQGITKDWKSDSFIISLSIDEKLSQEMVEEIQNCKLAINLKKWRQKRSLDANAYLWVLCTKLANKHDTSKEEIYEQMIQDYAPCYQDEDGNYVVITLKSSVDTSKIDGHWKFYRESSDGKFKSYLMLKGSSQYDTKEMSQFLDMVVQIAKSEGIDTATPDEIARMKALWGEKIGEKANIGPH